MSRPTIKVSCHQCDQPFDKDRREYNRQKKSGRTHFFCGRSCSAVYKNTLMPSDAQHLRSYRRKPSRHSEFLYYVRKAMSRRGDNIDVEYVAGLWKSQANTCAFTGLTLELNKPGTKQDLRFLASLDRLDSSRPYERGNLQFVSASLNLAKSDMSNESFVEFLELIRNSTYIH